MSKVFEDEFMDVQSSMIGLCLEAADGKADKIFMYGCNERNVKSVYVFFEANGQMKLLHQLGIPDDIQLSLLKLGVKDLQALDAVGKKYNREVPKELKLIYEVSTGKFEASYKYEPVCTAATGIDSDDVYAAWFKEMGGVGPGNGAAAKPKNRKLSCISIISSIFAGKQTKKRE